jgi:hypothetical protein
MFPNVTYKRLDTLRHKLEVARILLDLFLEGLDPEVDLVLNKVYKVL